MWFDLNNDRTIPQSVEGMTSLKTKDSEMRRDTPLSNRMVIIDFALYWIAIRELGAVHTESPGFMAFGSAWLTLKGDLGLGIAPQVTLQRIRYFSCMNDLSGVGVHGVLFLMLIF